MPSPVRLAVTGVGLLGMCAYGYRKKKTSAKCQGAVSQGVANAIYTARQIVTNVQNDSAVPGISVCVSVNGQNVWEEGFGFSDLENGTPCTPDTVMKIASISKPITMAMVAKAWEDGKIDLNAAVGEYVKQWPKKMWNGEEVSIQVRQLANHTSGLRNYKKLNESEKRPGFPEKMQFEEYFLTRHFKNVNEALMLFMDDPLVSKPGASFLYSNHGYTLLSACLEGVRGQSFPSIAHDFFHVLGMEHTYAEDNEALIYGRSRHYMHTADGQVANAPYVSTSYKMAGAGMWSNAKDIARFGNVLLYSYQSEGADMKGYLQPLTVKSLWTSTPGMQVTWGEKSGYGLGWQIDPYGGDTEDKFFVGHTGSTVGAGSVLMILPNGTTAVDGKPKGVVVAILCNLQVPLRGTAMKIAKLFEPLSHTETP